MPFESALRHGRLGGGRLHKEATTETPGFMSTEDKERLDELWETRSDGSGSGVVQITGTSGRITVSPSPIVGTGSIDLATSGVSAGSYGSSTLVPVITVDGYGRLTSVSTAAISGSGTVTQITAGTAITLSPSPITTTGSVSVNVSALEPLLTLNNIGGTLGVAKGGTNITSYTAGDILYATGATTLAKLAIGAANRALVSTGSAPSWAVIVNSFIGRTGSVVAAASDYDASQVDNDSLLSPGAAAMDGPYFVDDALTMQGTVGGFWYHDEMISAARFGGLLPWTVSTLAGSFSGVATSYGLPTTPGVCYLNPGTTAGQQIGANLGLQLQKGGGHLICEALITMDALSGAASTPSYQIFFGFANASPSSAGHVAGFWYDPTATTVATGGSGNWFAARRAGGGYGVTDTTVAAAASGGTTWSSSNDQRLRVEFNAAGGTCKWYVNGVERTSQTTALPTDYLGLYLFIRKVGATNTGDDVVLYVDYIDLGQLISLTSGER